MAEKPQARSGHAVARVAFTAHKDMVQAEADAGWSARAIYQRHPDELKCISYRQFVRYVQQLRADASPASKQASETKSETEGKPTSGRKVFANHDPNVSPDTDLAKKLTGSWR